MAIGRLHRGCLKGRQQVVLIKRDGKQVRAKVKELSVLRDRARPRPIRCAQAIYVRFPAWGFDIGDTLADPEAPGTADHAIDEPTMSRASINDSPFFGKEGNT